MKVTPLEIRQKSFNKAFRGYDKEEVDGYLNSLSQEWERVIEVVKEMKFKLQHAEAEVVKLKEVESSLYKTLRTAEETGANMIEQANKAAELHLKEAEMKAAALMNESKLRSKVIIEESEAKAKVRVNNLEDEIRNIEQSCKMIENYRANLLDELKMLSRDIVDKVDRVNRQQRVFPLEKRPELNVPNRSIAENVEEMPSAPAVEESADVVDDAAPMEEVKQVREDIAQATNEKLADITPEPKVEPSKNGQSFFDQF